jgi:hypothetical protein
MKYLLSLLVISLLFACGGKKEDPLTINPEQSEYAADGVINWASPQSLSLNTYYSLIDTVSSPPQLTLPITATATEGDSVRISWLLNGQPATGTTQQKYWDAANQRWLYGSSLIIPTSPFRSSVPVKADVYFLKANKTVSRNTILQFVQIKKTSDVLGVNFGMTRAQVKQAEYERLDVKDGTLEQWHEFSPSLAIISRSSNDMSNTYYSFDNGLLKSVSEAYSSTRVFSQLRDVAKKYRIPEEIKVNNTGDLDREYTWNNGKIKFTVNLRTFDTNLKQAAITYEKL